MTGGPQDRVRGAFDAYVATLTGAQADSDLPDWESLSRRSDGAAASPGLVRRWVTPLAAAAAAAVFAVGLAIVVRHAETGPNRAPTEKPTRGDLVSSTFAGLTLAHPSAWHAVPSVGPLSAGLSSRAGFLTSQTPEPQCSPSAGGGTTCHPPVTALTRGGVLVTITTRTGDPADLNPTTTIAGHPARVTRGEPSPDIFQCPLGAAFHVEADIDTSIAGFRQQVFVVGCFGPGDAQPAVGQFDLMLQTATYRKPG
jgi:hypothetical protein